MKSKDAGKNHDEGEPIGIVISRGDRTVDTPRFWAYVYSQAPETPSTVEVRAA